jgi:hypothetical protein
MSNLLSGFTVTSLTGSFLLIAVLVSARGQQMPTADPKRGLAFGDTDRHGKLSLDKFRELIEHPPRLKKVPPKKARLPLEGTFRRLDGDGDGFVNVPEFRRLSQLRQRRAGLRALAKGGFGPPAKQGARARNKAVASRALAPQIPRPNTARQTSDPAVTPEQAPRARHSCG